MKEKIHIPTLLFHSVREKVGDDLFATDPAKFADIITFISEKFGTVDFREFQRGNFEYDGQVLLTFDDGYRDNYEIALPILERNGVKALFFLLPKYLGQQNLWNTRAHVILDHLSEEEVKSILKQGHTIGSHGLTHHRLTKFEERDIVLELIESRQMLEDIFEVSIDCFAYPYGGRDERVIRLASGVYSFAFATDEASVDWTTSNFAEIRREFVWPHSNIEDIEELVVNFGTYDNNPYR